MAHFPPPNLTNPFRNEQHVRRGKTLFYEVSGKGDTYALFTLKDYDYVTVNGKALRSLYKAYMEMEDLTEHTFALTYLENWEHWMYLVDQDWFKPYINRWRTELELKIRARALKNMQAEAAMQSKSSFNANKWLAERGWIPKETEPNRRGRPSKQEISRRAAEEAFNVNQVNEDLKRLEVN